MQLVLVYVVQMIDIVNIFILIIKKNHVGLGQHRGPKKATHVCYGPTLNRVRIGRAPNRPARHGSFRYL